MNDMKNYIEPKFSITEFECEDIITASGTAPAMKVMDEWAKENNATVFRVPFDNLR